MTHPSLLLLQRVWNHLGPKLISEKKIDFFLLRDTPVEGLRTLQFLSRGLFSIIIQFENFFYKFFTVDFLTYNLETVNSNICDLFQIV